MTHPQTIHRALKVAAKEFNVHAKDIPSIREYSHIRGCIFYALRAYNSVSYITLSEVQKIIPRSHTTMLYWISKIIYEEKDKTILWQKAERIAKELQKA